MILSLALATFNEENNIRACIESCKALVDEIVVVDGSSTDKTVEIAKSLGAKVIVTDNPPMFHINKQKALRQAQGDWILQLDADERVTPELAEEIKKVITMNKTQMEEYENKLPEKRLFKKHQQLIMDRHSREGGNPVDNYNSGDPSLDPGLRRDDKQIVAFFIPRLNFFLGKYLRYGGVYPDGVIRLFKKGTAQLPCRDVHELMKVEGKIGWLQNPLKHIDSPTFKRYLERNNRYINLMVKELQVRHSDENRNLEKLGSRLGGRDDKREVWDDILLFFDYMFIKPISWFFMTTFRHKGILDGWQGVVFSFFSALRFPRAYIRFMLRS